MRTSAEIQSKDHFKWCAHISQANLNVRTCTPLRAVFSFSGYTLYVGPFPIESSFIDLSIMFKWTLRDGFIELVEIKDSDLNMNDDNNNKNNNNDSNNNNLSNEQQQQ